MQPGQILHQFTANDGREVILRTPKWEDLDDCLKLINALIDEGADIWMTEPVTRHNQIDWLSQRLAAIEKGEVIHIVTEVNDHVIANTELTIKPRFQSHLGEIGIIVLKDYRDLGIGTEMLKQLMVQAQRRGVKILTLGVFATNTRAIHVYEKLGFHECGRIPGQIFKNGQYIDHITMVKMLDETTSFSHSPQQP